MSEFHIRHRWPKLMAVRGQALPQPVARRPIQHDPAGRTEERRDPHVAGAYHQLGLVAQALEHRDAAKGWHVEALKARIRVMTPLRRSLSRSLSAAAPWPAGGGRNRFAKPIVVAALAGLTFAMAGPGSAEVRSLTIASSHPTSVPWVGVMQSHVEPELNRRLADAGVDLQIDWVEAYGGTLYNLNDTLEAVRDGLTDIGWVGTLWEGSKMPLQNVTYFAPFVTDDMHAVLDTMNELHDTIPAMKEAWLAQNQVFLGSSGVDTYHLMTDFPIEGVADLKGRRILAPGPAANWLEGTGAVAVDGGLPTYYTQIQTGVADGVVIILSGAYPFKIHEVAPYITLVGIGAQSAGAIAINKGAWDGLPPKAQQILAELGREYSTIHAAQVSERVKIFKEKMVAEGATMNELPALEREKWVAALPDIASEWVRANEAAGLPAKHVLAAYLEGVRSRGGRPARNWARE